MNTNGDEVSQLATTYSAEHIALFKQVVSDKEPTSFGLPLNIM